MAFKFAISAKAFCERGTKAGLVRSTLGCWDGITERPDLTVMVAKTAAGPEEGPLNLSGFAGIDAAGERVLRDGGLIFQPF